MNYGNNNGRPCMHCANSIDKHTINTITSDTATEALAKSLQTKVAGIYETALRKGYTFPTHATMIGAAIATIGSQVYKVATVSGALASQLLSYIPGGLGNDVTLIGDNVPAASFKTVLGLDLTTEIGAVTAMPAIIYPVGVCAGQKLLQYLISKSSASSTPKKPITRIHMAEIFWRTSDVNSIWSTGDIVPSCDTCKLMLPMMLCNYDASGNKVPYGYTSG